MRNSVRNTVVWINIGGRKEGGGEFSTCMNRENRPALLADSCRFRSSWWIMANLFRRQSRYFQQFEKDLF